MYFYPAHHCSSHYCTQISIHVPSGGSRTSEFKPQRWFHPSALPSALSRRYGHAARAVLQCRCYCASLLQQARSSRILGLAIPWPWSLRLELAQGGFCYPYHTTCSLDTPLQYNFRFTFLPAYTVAVFLCRDFLTTTFPLMSMSFMTGFSFFGIRPKSCLVRSLDAFDGAASFQTSPTMVATGPCIPLRKDYFHKRIQPHSCPRTILPRLSIPLCRLPGHNLIAAHVVIFVCILPLIITIALILVPRYPHVHSDGDRTTKVWSQICLPSCSHPAMSHCYVHAALAVLRCRCLPCITAPTSTIFEDSASRNTHAFSRFV